MELTVFEKTKIKSEVIGEMCNHLAERYRDVSQRYEVIGQKQRKDWRNGGALMWEDEEHTVPVMEDEYGYVAKNLEDLTEDDKYRMALYEKLGAIIEKNL